MHMLRLWLITLLLLSVCSAVWAVPVLLGTTMPRQVEAAGFPRSSAELVRVYADWPTIQPAKGTWNYARLDAAVNAARAAGQEVVLVLGPTPVWAVDGIANPSAEEARRAKPNVPAYKAFAAAVAKRYSGRVRFMQLWDVPANAPMLAMPRDIYVMFAEATRAIRAASPQMQVIVPEGGDVNLSWIEGYLKAVQGTSRADAILLIPARTVTSVPMLWPRMAALRTHVLPEDAPALWMHVSVQAGQVDDALQLAAGALLQNVHTIIFSPATADTLLEQDARFVQGVAALARVQGRTYAGWTNLGAGITGGIYPGEASTMALVVPLATGTVTVPGQSLQVYWPTASDPVTAAGPATLGLSTLTPVLIDGVKVPAVTPGVPELRAQPVSGDTVRLDPSGHDPAAIQLLPQLPGGRYRVLNINGRTALSTVRKTAPWIHLDVPDGFLFYNTERRPVEITVTVMGAQRPQKTGYFLYYDAHGGMANTPWQWIDVGPDQTFSYTMTLTDAIFANREGYDFRICMGGSSEEIKVVDVVVKKR